MSLGEIATEVGFQNQFHFSRSFKQAFGVPPTTMRQASPPELDHCDVARRIWRYL
jgi:AraC-like DNA-binding protein